MFGGIVSALWQQRLQREQATNAMLAQIMACIPGAYRVHVKDGVFTISCKTRVPMVTR